MSEVLDVLQEIMLRWCRKKFTRQFYEVLRKSLGLWKRMGYIQGVREVEVDYVWIKGSQDSYLKY